MISQKGLFVGQVDHQWQSGYQRLHALRSLGIAIEALPEPQPRRRQVPTVGRLHRLYSKDFFSRDEIGAYNDALLARLSGPVPDFIWFEWPRKMEADTLRAIKQRWPGCLLICFQDDNPFGARADEAGYWRRFLSNIPLYDVSFVKRDSDMIEFKRRGAKQVLLFMHGVFEPLFHPAESVARVTTSPWEVSFVGTALDHRVDYIAALLGKHRLPLRVFGTKWDRTLVGWLHRAAFHPPLRGEDYARAIRGSRISLGFVSSSNRDEYTMRTFEIPGCAGFLLAERTPTHLTLFEEGKEAEFFSSIEECADKIRFYLGHETARQRIALAGYERCIKSDYSLKSRMAQAFRWLFPQWEGPAVFKKST